MDRIAWWIVIAIITLFTGCSRMGTLMEPEKILQKPLHAWTKGDCDVVLSQFMTTNMHQPERFFDVYAFPCVPQALYAHNWKKRLNRELTEPEFVRNMGMQAQSCLGASYDSRNEVFIDKRRHGITDLSQLDSIMIIITISNTTNVFALPNLPVRQMASLNTALTRNIPDISHIRSEIALWDDYGPVSEPITISPNTAGTLLKEQTLHVMFPLTPEMKAYLKDHKTMNLQFNINNQTTTLPVRFGL